MDVEAVRVVRDVFIRGADRCIPDDLVRDRTHEIRETVFVSPIFFRGNRHGASRLLDVLMQCLVFRVRQLHDGQSMVAPTIQRGHEPRSQHPYVLRRRLDKLRSSGTLFSM